METSTKSTRDPGGATAGRAIEPVEIAHCRACGGRILEATGFAMDPMPLAAAFAPTRELALAAPRYPLSWVRCARCGLVQVLEDIPDAVLYSTYRYAASTVPALVRHHREFAAFLRSRAPYRAARVLEIGCNDGVLLRELPADWRLVGVDPSDVAAEAVGGWHLVNAAFDLATAREIEDEFGRFDLIVSSNSLAHFTDLAGALEGIAWLLAPDGEAWLEVHDLDATLATGFWSTIYHEHKAEWSTRSLANAALGLDLFAAWRLPLHGGLLRVGFRRRVAALRPTRVLAPEDFGQLIDAYAERRLEFDPSRPLVAYGAAASGSTWLNQMPDLPVEFVVDDSPLRQGLYVPGVGIPIVSPAELDDDDQVIMLAGNHAADIRARNPRVRTWLSI